MMGPAVPDATKGRRVVSQPDQAASSLDGEPDRSTFASAHGDYVPNLCGMVLSERGIFAGCLALVDPKALDSVGRDCRPLDLRNPATLMRQGPEVNRLDTSGDSPGCARRASARAARACRSWSTFVQGRRPYWLALARMPLDTAADRGTTFRRNQRCSK